jgi:hypothetical protein
VAIVIYHPNDGVYLGNCLGMGFWSNIDPVGQPSAVAFRSVEDAEAHMATWECGRPADLQFVEVVANEEGYAPMAACMAAGLPGWMDELTPVANALPA